MGPWREERGVKRGEGRESEGALKVLLAEEAVTIDALGEFGVRVGGEESLLCRRGDGAGSKEANW